MWLKNANGTVEYETETLHAEWNGESFVCDEDENMWSRDGVTWFAGHDSDEPVTGPVSVELRGGPAEDC